MSVLGELLAVDMQPTVRVTTECSATSGSNKMGLVFEQIFFVTQNYLAKRLFKV